MSDDKKPENNFKFGLYLRGEKIFERIFSADIYNPVVRYSVDIRDRIPSIIESIQKVLQTDSSKLRFSEYLGKSTMNYYKHICKINRMHPIKLFVPANNVKDRDNGQHKLKFPAKGTEFKFGLYINQNPIVERNFYVDNYNPEARFSNELSGLLNNIVGNEENYNSEWNFKSYLKKSDVNHMWNDYALIKTYELNIQQVRDLSKDRRKEFLERISDIIFVEKIRTEYNKNYEYSA